MEPTARGRLAGLAGARQVPGGHSSFPDQPPQGTGSILRAPEEITVLQQGRTRWPACLSARTNPTRDDLGMASGPTLALLRGPPATRDGKGAPRLETPRAAQLNSNGV